MPCTKFDDWLALQSSGDWLPLSEEMASHAKGCSECTEKMKAAQNFRQEFIQLAIPRSLLKTSWEKISSKISDQTELDSSKFGLNNRNTTWQWLLGASFAFSLILFFLISWGPNVGIAPSAPVESLKSPDFPGLGTLQGSAGKIVRHEQEMLVAKRDLNFQANDELILSLPHSWAKVHFVGGSQVQLEGICKIRFFPEEFQVDSGVCLVSIKKGNHPLKICVPGAILGIRGTVLRFNLTANGGTIDLLEGIIDVEPSSGRLASFSWNAGTRLSISERRIIGKPVIIPLAQGSIPSHPHQASNSEAEPISNANGQIATSTSPNHDSSMKVGDLNSVLSTK